MHYQVSQIEHNQKCFVAKIHKVCCINKHANSAGILTTWNAFYNGMSTTFYNLHFIIELSPLNVNKQCLSLPNIAFFAQVSRDTMAVV